MRRLGAYVGANSATVDETQPIRGSELGDCFDRFSKTVEERSNCLDEMSHGVAELVVLSTRLATLVTEINGSPAERSNGFATPTNAVEGAAREKASQ